MSKFKEIDVNSIQESPFKLIGNDFMLVTAGNKEKLNTMTASWGGLGVLWGKNVSFTFVRPQRYTFEFLENNEYYTLSFYDNSFKDMLMFCGTKSGRDIDKVKESSLIPIFDEDAPYFEQAKLVLICKKLYGQFINPDCFLSKEIEKNYPLKDYHKMFIGEIVKAIEKI